MIHDPHTFTARFQCFTCRTQLKARIKRSCAGKKIWTKCVTCESQLLLRIPERVANVAPVPPPVKTIKKGRNELRNAPLGEVRECKHCKFPWAADTHLGRFESYQSRCLNGKKACADVHPRKAAAA